MIATISRRALGNWAKREEPRGDERREKGGEPSRGLCPHQLAIGVSVGKVSSHEKSIRIFRAAGVSAISGGHCGG